GQHPNREADYPCTVNWPAETSVDRLTKVKIEHGDYKEKIRKHDSPGTLFYLDPPYYGTRNDYGPGLDLVDPREIKRIALDTKGKVLISLNDHPHIRELFCKDRPNFECHNIKQPVLGTGKGAAGFRNDLLIIKTQPRDLRTRVWNGLPSTLDRFRCRLDRPN